MLYGKDDYTSRWLQLVIAIVTLPIAAVLEWQGWFGSSYAYRAGGLPLTYLGLRCLWYAITGRNNINRDDLNSGSFS